MCADHQVDPWRLGLRVSGTPDDRRMGIGDKVKDRSPNDLLKYYL